MEASPTTSKSRERPTVPCPRPRQDQVAPYHWTYVELVRDDDVLVALEREGRATARLLSGLDEARGEHRYAPGKWSVKELASHLVDTERVFAYRALRVARGDRTPLPGYDHDAYVRSARTAARTLGSLVDELLAVRAASLALFRSLDAEAWRQTGTANELPVLAATFPWLTLGHELHHREVLRQKYL